MTLREVSPGSRVLVCGEELEVRHVNAGSVTVYRKPRTMEGDEIGGLPSGVFTVSPGTEVERVIGEMEGA